ncbi:xylulokinase [Actinocrispum wychmicini]|uniref:Xylulose kinase n=1 Tax=Actinocrispum wychmicini TaxID=1213861 RepID=A0A4R2IZ42_9PSEU|nr:xylulokinase [Actinocrispum wychmicini]TCO50914.1 xylulokinase [Actinocrispum wychmicini]
MALVAGVDSSTQSTKVVVVDADTGTVLREGRADHPDRTEVHPDEWWRAYREATAGGLLDGVSAIGVGGQQHGMVTLDENREVVRPALLWNDTRSADAAADLIRDLGGPDSWADAVGLVPVASFTVTKLRWLATHEPDLAARVATVVLPHDWLTYRLTGSLVTDRGDASGTGYYSAAQNAYRTDLLELAFGRAPELPRVLGPSEPAGTTSDGVLVSAGTGDNMAAALGLGLGVGDAAVSIGTSGTVFGVADSIRADGTGAVAGFADATGRFLPLVCTLNAARVLTATAAMLGVSLSEMDALALSAAPGADGLTMVPYLDGERTPNLPDATGSLLGMRRDNMTPANVARAAVEGMLSGLGAGIEALRAVGTDVKQVRLIGGGAQSKAVQAIAPEVLGVPVTIPAPAEYVALGAARQAAWALTGEPPTWS